MYALGLGWLLTLMEYEHVNWMVLNFVVLTLLMKIMKVVVVNNDDWLNVMG